MPKILSQEKRTKIVHLFGQGMAKRQIAKEVDCSERSVFDIIKKFQNTGSIECNKRTNFKRKTTVEKTIQSSD